jgi:hypothetical protein
VKGTGKISMKKTASFALIVFLGLQTVKAQLGCTYDEVIGNFGDTYKTGISDQRQQYIFYKRHDRSALNGFIHYQLQDSSAASGKYTRSVYFYFTKSENGNAYCNEELILEPRSEIGNWIDMYKSRYEEIGHRIYKDKANNVFFKVRIRGDFCVVNIWYE